MVEDQTIIDTYQKAEALRNAILSRFNAEDDLQTDLPSLLEDNARQATGQLPWDTYISLEEAEQSTIGMSSTSPGIDQVIVCLLKAC